MKLEGEGWINLDIDEQVAELLDALGAETLQDAIQMARERSGGKMHSHREWGHAFEDLANTCDLVIIEHDEDGQRITARRGLDVYTHVDPFAGEAAVVIMSKILDKK